jgi:hypothetical protein
MATGPALVLENVLLKCRPPRRTSVHQSAHAAIDRDRASPPPSRRANARASSGPGSARDEWATAARHRPARHAWWQSSVARFTGGKPKSRGSDGPSRTETECETTTSCGGLLVHGFTNGCWRGRRDSYEAGRCQDPTFSQRAHLLRCREIDPSFGNGGAAFFNGERGSEYAAGATATTQSWRLRFARAVALTATPIRVGAMQGPNRDVMAAIVVMKRRNPTGDCPRNAQQIALAFGI